jgi:ABC-type polar amino acid transport system ATPase subunit
VDTRPVSVAIARALAMNPEAMLFDLSHIRWHA